MSLPTLDELMSMEIGSIGGQLIPLGAYLGVVTNVELRSGKKGPYLNIEVTLHSDNDGNEDFRGRKVWRNASFSEKALGMPGGIAELVQATRPNIPKNTSGDSLPSALAVSVHGSPVGIVVDHEARMKDGKEVIDPVTGEIQLRETISQFFPAPDSFASSVENEVAGIDDDLPF